MKRTQPKIDGNRYLISHKPDSLKTESKGYCQNCKKVHRLESNGAVAGCHQLMEQLKSEGTIDLFRTSKNSNKRLKTEYLFGPARGKMFGVMECIHPDGTIKVLRAFSGQYNGVWQVEGWVLPLFDVDAFFKTSNKIERQIKDLSRELDTLTPNSNTWFSRKKERRLLSRSLMRDIHNLYQLTNFHGRTTALHQAYYKKNGIPTGTGDCCAPKLLNHAAKHGLIPLGIAEFFWGKENRSTSRQHRSFYPSCREKCEPILGFMLCGLESI